MSDVVLDASAILAFTKSEPGSEVVRQRMFNAAVSAVNYAEVLQKAGTTQENCHLLDSVVRNFRITIIDFTMEHARCVAKLYLAANKGVSLGDRACLATASLLGVPVLTGDRRWLELGLPLDIACFRP